MNRLTVTVARSGFGGVDAGEHWGRLSGLLPPVAIFNFDENLNVFIRNSKIKGNFNYLLMKLYTFSGFCHI